jgi:hypothetical protein
MPCPLPKLGEGAWFLLSNRGVAGESAVALIEDTIALHVRYLITSTPPMYGFNTSGTAMLPSFCW